MKELFPSWYHVKTHEEVLRFTCGLMSDPQPLIEHVGGMLVEQEVFTCRIDIDLETKAHLKNRGKDILLLNLMTSLYAEAEVVLQDQPHHNKMFNFYSHKQDDLCERRRDIIPIQIASKLYLFEFVKESLPSCNISELVGGQNCHIVIRDIHESIAGNVLSVCHAVSQHQPVDDLWIKRLYCESGLDLKVFRMSDTAQSISILKSTLPYSLLEYLISQLPISQHLIKLDLKNIRLCNLPKWDNMDFTPGNPFDIIGRNIASGIRKWGDSPPLQQLRLANCCMGEDVCGDLMKSLSNCHHLTHLDFGGNTFGPIGKCLAELIRKLGVNPTLQQLYLTNCTMPEDVCREILESLFSCKRLSHLDLSGNDVGNAGKYISQIIRNSHPDSPLQLLYLENSSIPTGVCNDIFRALSVCRKLAYLNLSGLDLGKAKLDFVNFLRNFRDNLQLQRLYLQNCSLPEDVCGEILTSPACKYLTHLKVSGNSVGETGKHLIEIIDRGSLEQLYLSDCKIPHGLCGTLLANLSRCSRLFKLSLAGNCLTGVLTSFHADPESASPYLRKLHLESAQLNKDDISHIRRLIETHRLPELGGPDAPDGLWLQGNNLVEMQQELEFLLEACIKEYNRELRIGLWNNNLSVEFQTQWQKRCEGTSVILLFEKPAD